MEVPAGNRSPILDFSLLDYADCLLTEKILSLLQSLVFLRPHIFADEGSMGISDWLREGVKKYKTS